VTNHQSPPGQREYLPIALTLKGQRLLDKASDKSELNNKKTAKKKRRFVDFKKLISRVEVKWTLGIAISICGLFLTYKSTGQKI